MLCIRYISLGIALLNISQSILYRIQFCTHNYFQVKDLSDLFLILSGPFLYIFTKRKDNYDHVELLYC